MIAAVEFPRALNGDHVPGIGHYAHDTGVPFLGGADGAHAAGGQVLTDGAAGDVLLGVQDRLGEFLGFALAQAQHIKGQALGAFAADAGKLGELLHQFF